MPLYKQIASHSTKQIMRLKEIIGQQRTTSDSITHDLILKNKTHTNNKVQKTKVHYRTGHYSIIEC